jgi:hypothetical protein
MNDDRHAIVPATLKNRLATPEITPGQANVTS